MHYRPELQDLWAEIILRRRQKRVVVLQMLPTAVTSVLAGEISSLTAAACTSYVPRFPCT